MKRPYEVVLIIDSALDEDAIKATLDKATDLVKTQGGLVGRVEKWGRKRFAYELKNSWEEENYARIHLKRQRYRHACQDPPCQNEEPLSLL